MNIQFSKFIVPLVLIGIGLAAAIFILPVVGAILIGAFALSALLWLSGKIFGFFQVRTDYSESNPSDLYETAHKRDSVSGMIPRHWRKNDAVDAEIIVEENNDRNKI